MAKPKPKLGGALDDLAQVAPAAVAIPVRTVGAGRPKRTEETYLVGGQLALRYGRTLNMLSAETGKTNRQLLEEALDGLFVKYGSKIISV